MALGLVSVRHSQLTDKVILKTQTFYPTSPVILRTTKQDLRAPELFISRLPKEAHCIAGPLPEQEEDSSPISIGAKDFLVRTS